MKLDTERAKEKRDELIELARQTFSFVEDESEEARCHLQPDPAARWLVDNFISITPPEAKPRLVHLVTIHSGGAGGGQSVKPGNFSLNLRKLTDAVASGVLTVAGSTTAPWLLLLAGIVLWNRVWSELTIELSERDAAVLWTLWENRDENNYVSLPNLLEVVNRGLGAHSREPITEPQLEASLATLQRISSIEKSAAESSSWWLREWVRVNYR